MKIDGSVYVQQLNSASISNCSIAAGSMASGIRMVQQREEGQLGDHVTSGPAVQHLECGDDGLVIRQMCDHTWCNFAAELAQPRM